MKDLTSGFRAMCVVRFCSNLFTASQWFLLADNQRLAFAALGYSIRFEPILMRRVVQGGQSSQKVP